nr:enoyl-CoA hydratase/isomerase family protein [Pseudomonas sp.]
MSASLVAVEYPQPEIAVVHMRREEKMNALNDELIQGLTDVGEQLMDDATVKAVILTGGKRVFSAGADVSTFDGIDQETNVNRVRRMTQKGVRMADLWQNLPAVTIAAVEGGAVGGGLGMALSCDWRVFSRDAWGYVPEVRLGLNYGWGTLAKLSALAGPARAKWISILCRRHPAAELFDWGVVEHVSEPGKALDEALVLAREVAGLPALAPQMIKRSVNAYAFALAKSSTYADMDDMLVCMTDEEGRRAREQTTREVGKRAK